MTSESKHQNKASGEVLGARKEWSEGTFWSSSNTRSLKFIVDDNISFSQDYWACFRLQCISSYLSTVKTSAVWCAGLGFEVRISEY